MIRTVDPLNDRAWRDLVSTSRGQPLLVAPVARSHRRHLRLRHRRAHDRSTRATPEPGSRSRRSDDFLGARQLSVPFCDYIDPIVDTDDDWHELVDPLLDRGLPLQLRVLDAEPPRRDPRFVLAEELAWHCTDPRMRRGTALRRDESAGPAERARGNPPRRDRAVRLRPRRRACVSRPPPAHAEAQVPPARAAVLVLREHLEAVRTRRRPRDRARRARRRRDRGRVLPRVERRLVLQVRRVDPRTFERAAERAARLGEHAAARSGAAARPTTGA